MEQSLLNTLSYIFTIVGACFTVVGVLVGTLPTMRSNIQQKNKKLDNMRLFISNRRDKLSEYEEADDVMEDLNKLSKEVTRVERMHNFFYMLTAKGEWEALEITKVGIKEKMKRLKKIRSQVPQSQEGDEEEKVSEGESLVDRLDSSVENEEKRQDVGDSNEAASLSQPQPPGLNADIKKGFSRRLIVLIGVGILLLLLGLVGFVFVPKDIFERNNNNNNKHPPSSHPATNPTTAPNVDNPTPTVSPSTAVTLDSSDTISSILNKGTLTCGITSQQGYAMKNTQGQWEGFEVDLCRAVAAGIFGKDNFQGGRDAEPVQFVEVEAPDRFISLNNEEIDLLFGITSQTLERTVHEASNVGGSEMHWLEDRIWANASCGYIPRRPLPRGIHSPHLTLSMGLF